MERPRSGFAQISIFARVAEELNCKIFTENIKDSETGKLVETQRIFSHYLKGFCGLLLRLSLSGGPSNLNRCGYVNVY